MRARISPCCPRPTASGLISASVRSIANVISSDTSNERGCCSLDSLQCRSNARSQFRRCLYGVNSGCLHRRVLVLCGSLSTTDDCAGMAHAPPGRSRLASDKPDDGLLHVRADPCGGALFRVAPNLPDPPDGLGV